MVDWVKWGEPEVVRERRREEGVRGLERRRRTTGTSITRVKIKARMGRVAGGRICLISKRTQRQNHMLATKREIKI